MIMLINLEGILAQTRIGVGRVTLPSKRPTTGQYGILMAQFQTFIRFIVSIIISQESHLFITLK